MDIQVKEIYKTVHSKFSLWVCDKHLISVYKYHDADENNPLGKSSVGGLRCDVCGCNSKAEHIVKIAKKHVLIHKLMYDNTSEKLESGAERHRFHQ